MTDSFITVCGKKKDIQTDRQTSVAMLAQAILAQAISAQNTTEVLYSKDPVQLDSKVGIAGQYLSIGIEASYVLFFS